MKDISDKSPRTQKLKSEVQEEGKIDDEYLDSFLHELKKVLEAMK